MPGWKLVPLEQVPRVAHDEPGVTWHPLQHAFGLTAFGANAFVAERAGESLIDAHDETASGQEELYLIVRGRVRFTIGGAAREADALSALAVTDPALDRSAIALEPGSTLIALGGVPRADFRSTWRSEHFEGVDRLT